MFRFQRFRSIRLFSSEGFPSRVGSWYTKQLTERPILTKSLTSGLIGAGGDLLCQWGLVDAVPDYKIDWQRCKTFTLLQTFLVGPVLHYWYTALLLIAPGRAMRQVAVRLALDQLIFAPVFIGVFMSSIMFLQEKEDKILDKLKQDYANTIKANWKVWIPASFANFSLVPAQYQVLFANLVGLFWNSYLSFASFRGLKKSDVVEDKPV